MKMPKNYFKNLFKREKIQLSEDNLRVNIDFSVLGIRLDRAQDAMKYQLLQDMLLYVPTGDTLALRNDIIRFNETNGQRDAVYAYNPNGTPYAHYQYEGVMYADPETGKGAFYNAEYGYWSRPGVQKVKTNRVLRYRNPNARRQWLKYAAEHHREDVMRAAQRGFRR